MEKKRIKREKGKKTQERKKKRNKMYSNGGFQFQNPGTFTSVTSGQEYAQQNYAGHQQYSGNDPRYQAQPSCGMVATSTCGVASKQACGAGGVEPASFYPYSGGNAAAAYDASYPNEEDMSSLYPRGCPASQQAGYELNVNSLMPAAWRSSPGMSGCSGAAVDGSQWTKYAPTKQAFDRYITAQGSARLQLTTRSPLGRQVGVPDLLRQAPPMPLAAEQVVFNDSGMRLDNVFRATGRYPESTSC
jgi:hypothetical protein